MNVGMGTLAHMSAPQQLTQAQRGRLQTAHHLLSRREMVQYWWLSEEERKQIEKRRRDHNRLGFGGSALPSPISRLAVVSR